MVRYRQLTTPIYNTSLNGLLKDEKEIRGNGGIVIQKEKNSLIFNVSKSFTLESQPQASGEDYS